jgi:peptidoglycan/LPS O-acetylase OafA/YrhL
MTVRNRSFVTLDGLRGIAALAILTRHAPAFFASVAIMIPLSGRTGPAVSVGPFYESYLAVDFFFALSGFVLAHAYGARLGSSLSGLRFMAVRLIRLYPLYVFALLIATLLAVPRALSHDQSGLLETLKNLLPAILFLPAPPVSGDAVLFPFNGPAWSLFFELLANGCIAIVGFRLRSRTLGAIVGIAGLALAAAISVLDGTVLVPDACASVSLSSRGS